MENVERGSGNASVGLDHLQGASLFLSNCDNIDFSILTPELTWLSSAEICMVM